ncbi:MAG TPA: hypothetical protein VGJ30_05800 [Candidatus Angelobacter sp.]|jgi:hypothetical protein
MKTILTGTLMVALLAASVSAFAESGNGKQDNAATPTNMTQQDNCNQSAKDAGKQDEQKSSENQQIEQQDKDWLHDLQGAYGG